MPHHPAYISCLVYKGTTAASDAERHQCNGALRTRLPALGVLNVSRQFLGLLNVDIVSENCPLLEKLDLSRFGLDADSWSGGRGAAAGRSGAVCVD